MSHTLVRDGRTNNHNGIYRIYATARSATSPSQLPAQGAAIGPHGTVRSTHYTCTAALRLPWLLLLPLLSASRRSSSWLGLGIGLGLGLRHT